MGKGWAKSKSAIPVRSPSVAVFRAREGKAELARGVKRLAEKSYERRWRPDQAEIEGSGRQGRKMLRVISALSTGKMVMF